jgi:hypothetical protein
MLPLITLAFRVAFSAQNLNSFATWAKENFQLSFDLAWAKKSLTKSDLGMT